MDTLPALAALVAYVLILGGAARVEACASCGCGERHGSLSLGEGDDVERVQFLRSTLSASWSATNWLTFEAKLPWLTSFIAYGTAPYALVNGLGDLELAGRFVVFRERRFAPHHLLSASVGLKMPTGYAVHDRDGARRADRRELERPSDGRSASRALHHSRLPLGSQIAGQ